MLNSVVYFYFAAWGKQMNQRGHPLESSGQAGSCAFLNFLTQFKYDYAPSN